MKELNVGDTVIVKDIFMESFNGYVGQITDISSDGNIQIDNDCIYWDKNKVHPYRESLIVFTVIEDDACTAMFFFKDNAEEYISKHGGYVQPATLNW